MIKERRGARRIATELIARWDPPPPPHEGRIIDLSVSGCFILTAGRVSANKLSRVDQAPSKEPILIRVLLPHGERLGLGAEVVYRVEGVGFAARFVNLAPAEEQALRTFIDAQGAGKLHRPGTGKAAK
ncbi:MAG: PilZ domain-containing protein [Pyrinomonadaceae bacterium]